LDGPLCLGRRHHPAVDLGRASHSDDCAPERCWPYRWAPTLAGSRSLWASQGTAHRSYFNV